MKAIPLGLIGLAFFVACAEQQDAPPTTCNARSAGCVAAGSGSTAGSGGSVNGGAGGGLSAGATSMAGADPSGGGSPPSAGASSSGAPGAGAPGAGAPGAGAPGAGAPGAGAGGAPGAGAPGAGAPGAGAPGAGAPGAGAGGAPVTGGVVIETNRSDGSGARAFLKVVPPDNYLQWVGTSAADAEVFQEVVVATDQVKLLATSVNKYVALDQTVPTTPPGNTAQSDYLVANATMANAAVLNIALCAATNAAAAKCAPNCRGIQVMDDDDVNNFVASDDQFNLKYGARARSNSCGGNQATAWESWEIIPH